MAGRRKAAAKPDVEEAVAEEVVHRGQTRQELGALLNSDTIREKLEELVNQVLDLKGLQWGYCGTCRKRVQVEVADLKGRVDGLIKLLEQAEGKPKEDGDAGITITVVRPPRT